MESLIIKGTMKIPDVRFDFDQGRLDLYGRSIPENAKEFYAPLNEWVTDYLKNPKPNTTINLKILYFNTRSTKALLDLLGMFEEHHEKTTKVIVNWYYEKDDDDILEVGQDYEDILNIPFSLIEYGSVGLK